MTPSQRSVLQRLADAFDPSYDAPFLIRPMAHEIVTTLRELLAEPQGEPVAWVVYVGDERMRAFDCEEQAVRWHRNETQYGSPYIYRVVPAYTHPPQQPMRCPDDGGECGAGGYCRPEPVQRKPLTREQIDTVWSSLGSFTDRESDYRIFARAIERAHGITGEPT